MTASAATASAMTAALFAAATLPAQAAPLMRAAGGKPACEDYVRAWGVRAEDASRAFGSDGSLAVEQIGASVPCNVARPGERVSATIQLRNLSDAPMAVRGRWLFVPDTLETRGDDVFDLALVGGEPAPCGDVRLDLAPRAVARVEVGVPLPERFGAGALLLETAGRGEEPVRFFAAHFARCIAPENPPGARFHQVCMDLDDPALVARLGTAPNRVGVAFVPSDDPGCDAYYAHVAEKLRTLGETGYPVAVEFGAGPDRGACLPLGRVRPHLSDDGSMMRTKSDYAWLPERDGEFRERVRALVAEFGRPHGPVNAVKLWNEPWNGLSISGWGADDLRYREMFTAMCEGVEEARAADSSLDVLTGGCDSAPNTFDKLFPDGDLRFLPWLDFLSLHYHGLQPSNPRMLRDRSGPRGRTLFWDTESWVANSPDRVPCVLAGMLAAGHDRVVGIQGYAVVATPFDAEEIDPRTGARTRRRLAQAWPVAPALCAFQRFVGNRRFDGFQWEGLPWVWRFRGDGADDLTLVVCGDLSPVFDGPGRSGALPFWTAREAAAAPLPDAGMLLSGARGVALFDGNGNLLAKADSDGRLDVPLSDAGLYLRPDGSPGSAERLLAAVDAADLRGVPAVAPALVDATAPVGSGAVFRIRLRNLLNRPVRGTLRVEVGGLSPYVPRRVEIPPHGEADVPLRATAGDAEAENAYPVRLSFAPDGGPPVEWGETLRVNLVAAGAPADPDDFETWKTPWPQPVVAGGDGATQMERAWLPMLSHETAPPSGAAVAWLRADDDFLYFAAQIADATPDPGMPRFETRDEDADFYPAVAFEPAARDGEAPRALRWPEGVRRFSYRRRPELPNGAAPAHDNVQLAFNVLSDAEKPWHPAAPGTFKGYAGYWDTDWEFALNPVSDACGGGTEVWTLRAPGLPDKHYYPRCPKAPGEGPVRGAALRCRRDATHRYVTCALPWSAFPALAAARAEGRPFAFSFRVNDNGAPGACMELARRRSVSKRNNSFKPDWGEHWANALLFGWEAPHSP